MIRDDFNKYFDGISVLRDDDLFWTMQTCAIRATGYLKTS